MISISNDDYMKVMRLLRGLVGRDCRTVREAEDRRKACLLLRKWERKNQKKSVSLHP